MTEIGVGVTVGLSVIGAGVWLLRLEGRINTHDSQHADLTRRHDDLKADLVYIRSRIDRALGVHE